MKSLIFLAAVLLSSCLPQYYYTMQTWEKDKVANRSAFASVKAGMNADSLFQLLGRPSYTSSKGDSKVLIYKSTVYESRLQPQAVQVQQHGGAMMPMGGGMWMSAGGGQTETQRPNVGYVYDMMTNVRLEEGYAIVIGSDGRIVACIPFKIEKTKKAKSIEMIAGRTQR